MIISALLSLALTNPASAGAPRAWRALRSRCQNLLAPVEREIPIRLKNGSFGRLSPVTWRNLPGAWQTASRVFPKDKMGVGSGFAAAIVPRELLGRVSPRAVSVKLASVDYWLLHNQRDRPVGLVGLYAADFSTSVWLGWYGLSAESRGTGAGGAMLDWAIDEARRRGYGTLRLWTTTAPEYEAANQLYAKRGFVKQRIHMNDPDEDNVEVILYALGLHGQTPQTFAGTLREALLGASANYIDRGIKKYSEKVQR